MQKGGVRGKSGLTRAPRWEWELGRGSRRERHP